MFFFVCQLLKVDGRNNLFTFKIYFFIHTVRLHLWMSTCLQKTVSALPLWPPRSLARSLTLSLYDMFDQVTAAALTRCLWIDPLVDIWSHQPCLKCESPNSISRWQQWITNCHTLLMSFWALRLSVCLSLFPMVTMTHSYSKRPDHSQQSVGVLGRATVSMQRAVYLLACFPSGPRCHAAGRHHVQL